HICHKNICPTEKGKCPILDLGENKIDNAERIALGKDGREIPILKTVLPIKLGDEEVLIESFVDLTKQKQMEEELKRAYKESEELLNAAADGIRIVNKDFTVRALNSTMAELAGVDEKKSIGMKCHEMFGSDVCGTNECSMARVLREGKPIHTQSVRRRVNGEKVPCLHVATPLKDVDGNIIGIIEDFRDITEQKQLEEEIRRQRDEVEHSRRELQRYIDNLLTFNARLNLDGIVEIVNKTAIEAIDVNPEMVIGRHLADTPWYSYDVELQDRIRGYIGRAVRGEKILVEEKMKVKEDFRVYQISIKPVLNEEGDIEYLIAEGRDISNLKAIEEKIREEEERLRDFLENINDLVQIVDPDGRFIYVNNEWLKTLGYTREEIEHMTVFDIIREDCRSHCMQVFERLLRGESISKVETVFIAKDGREIYVEGRMNARFENGKFVSTRGIYRNVSERKRFEEELMKLKKRFEDVAFSSNDFIWEVDVNGRYTFVTGKTEEILGYTSDELIGKTLFDLMPEDEAERISKIFLEEIIPERKPIVDLENWNLTKDGRKICFLTNGVPIFDENDNFLGYRGVDKDITHWKKLEQSLRENEERHRTVLRSMGVLIFLIDGEDRFKDVYCGPGFPLYRKPEEFIGRRIDEVMPPSVSGPYLQYSLKVRETGETHSFEYPLEINGESRWFEAILDLYEDGESVIARIRDITEKKMMEHVVKEKEELFRTISDFAYDAIIMIDDNGCITYWNKAAERIFGYTRDEILGRNLHEILAPLHLYETFENAFTLFRETGDGIAIGKTLEMPFIKKDGTESVGELSISSVKIKDKWHTIGIVRDIRERKKMEEELKEKVEELENFHKVAVDRELRMIELKKEINELCEKYGEKPRYNLNVEG
ncbi:MAG: hypothetical protein DRN12_07725, partial [Thermoplasmata archaeon]